MSNVKAIKNYSVPSWDLNGTQFNFIKSSCDQLFQETYLKKVPSFDQKGAKLGRDLRQTWDRLGTKLGLKAKIKLSKSIGGATLVGVSHD